MERLGGSEHRKTCVQYREELARRYVAQGSLSCGNRTPRPSNRVPASGIPLSDNLPDIKISMYDIGDLQTFVIPGYKGRQN